MRILVIQGPNLNMLGVREPEIYGRQTLEMLHDHIKSYAQARGVQCAFFQSNHEGDLVDKIQSVLESFDGCIINAGALTHYSYAIHDAIQSVPKPFIEVHLSDIRAREPFRRHSVLEPVCKQTIAGHGEKSYFMAIDALLEMNQSA